MSAHRFLIGSLPRAGSILPLSQRRRAVATRTIVRAVALAVPWARTREARAPPRLAMRRAAPGGTKIAWRPRGPIMRALADRVAKAVSDVTVGTVIVLFHVALAERERARQLRRGDRERRRPDLLAE
jgi:hypothetical protein